jgi:uncharacterized membrane-anchored protein
VAALAVFVCAWFALGIHQAHDVSRATAILGNGAPISSASGQRAASLAASARTLNPDRTPDILAGRAALQTGDSARARTILQSVVRAEPMNIDAWVWLAHASTGDQLADALRHVHELERSFGPVN